MAVASGGRVLHLRQGTDLVSLQVVMDATLAAMICGWIPTPRPKMVRTLKAPDFCNAACTHPGCRIKGCTGNLSNWDAEDLCFR